MAELCRFLGMVITMYPKDHPPPHLHVAYSGEVVRVALSGEILSGTLPSRQRRALRKWMRLHQDELEACWKRAMRLEPPGTIEPL